MVAHRQSPRAVVSPATPHEATPTASPPPSELKMGERYGYFTPLERIGQGGMGTIYRIQLHRDDFAPAYFVSHVLSGDFPPKVIGIPSYRAGDPEFEEEAAKRIQRLDRRSPVWQRLIAELEQREPGLVRASYVAVAKIPRTDQPEAVTRFLREIRALHNMGDHPHIVKYILCDTLGRQPLLITEFFPARNLVEIMSESRLVPEQAVSLYQAALKAVHHAHLRGIIHRDVKPSNILTDGRMIKITDFGLAKAIEDEAGQTRVTQPDQIVGTPAYMAPEQINPALGPVCEATDMYQLGQTLFEMLTGRPLYDEREYRKRLARPGSRSRLIKDTEPAYLIMDEIGDPARMHPVFPRDLHPELSDEIERLVMTSCQKDPLERYPCEIALAQAEELLRGRRFFHPDPCKVPSPERKRNTRAELVLSASAALLARHAYDEAAAYENCIDLLGRATVEGDVIARADILKEVFQNLSRLPPAKYGVLHEQYAALTAEMQPIQDDIEAFRPNRKIALEVGHGYDRLRELVESEALPETSAVDFRQKVDALRLRAEQHLERIRRTGLPEKITGQYLSELERILGELPRLPVEAESRRTAFIGARKEELERAQHPEDRVQIAGVLRRALENAAPDEATRRLLADLQERFPG